MLVAIHWHPAEVNKVDLRKAPKIEKFGIIDNQVIDGS